MSDKFIIEESDFGSTTGDYGNWLGKSLYSEGNTLDELLDNATYFLIDQDGGEAGELPADDNRAIRFITSEYYRLAKKGIHS